MKSNNISHCQNNYKIQYKFVERVKIDTPNMHIHASISTLCTDTSMKRGGGKLVYINKLLIKIKKKQNIPHCLNNSKIQ